MSDISLSSQISDRLPALKRHALYLTRNEADAEDLVQDCVERGIRRQEQFQPGTNLDAWLHTIMRNIFINGKRHEKLVRRHVQRETLAENDSVRPSQIDHIELKQVLEECDRLSEEHRRVIQLLCVQQVSYQEAAREIDIPEATAKTRLFRARERLRMKFAA